MTLITIGTYAAVDPDSTVEANITYELTGGDAVDDDDNNLFDINTDGALTLCG